MLCGGIVTIRKLYAMHLKMYTILSTFYAVHSILPLYLHQKAMWRNCKGMILEVGTTIK